MTHSSDGTIFPARSNFFAFYPPLSSAQIRKLEQIRESRTTARKYRKVLDEFLFADVRSIASKAIEFSRREDGPDAWRDRRSDFSFHTRREKKNSSRERASGKTGLM